MSVSEYRPRVIDKLVDEYLTIFGAVCIEGPKWCGKTRTSNEHSKSSIFLGDPRGNFQNRNLAVISPELVLQGEYPRLIDEWQEVPALWDAVRYFVDTHQQKGLFVLTGSSTPNRKGILHSGAGRIARLRMRPMSLWESGDSSGNVSLRKLFTGENDSVMTGDVSLIHIINLIVRGGWPGSIGISPESAGLLAKEYINAVINDDASRIDGIKRDKQKLELLLRSLARNESTTASNLTLKKDMQATEGFDIDKETIAMYLDVFNRLFLIDNQRPFAPSLRSSVRIKQQEKRHFCDPSLAVAILNATPSMLINDLETLGFLFESLCVRDLRIYAESFNAQLYHYQDYKNREVDAVISFEDGSWGAFEIKLGANQIESAAKNLLALRNDLMKENPKLAPSLLCVICGLSNAAYLRPDGVFVVPITALKP
ncbi:ATP-binding protein [Succinatimonas hippei]|uniref:ATP-binding protein n=1 Tax=Succinatimonas hippei TaxID=626938 RepID=UPI0026EF8C9D|nr:DUF4143 domain-containing protein [Succinatimonas hippei]